MIALAKPSQLNSIDEVIHGESLAVLRTLPDNSVDAIVCDPPAGISFMGKEWDKADTWPLEAHPGKRLTGSGNPTSAHGFGSDIRINPGKKERDAFISFITAIMAEALRVLKPGGHAFVWALPRTSHWTGMALEDAGFEVRDVITHLFGSGFPKSMDVSKAIDRMAGAEREVVGIHRTKDIRRNVAQDIANGWETRQGKLGTGAPTQYMDYAETAPATPEASQWDGWGTALKPAAENWYLVRKPLSEKSIAENVLKWGVGAINIAASRVGTDWATDANKRGWQGGHHINETRMFGFTNTPEPISKPHPQGRFPSNLLLSHSLFCVPNVDDWLCDESCPVRLLDEQSGMRKSGLLLSHQVHRTQKNTYGKPTQDNTDRVWGGDQGGASRYFQRFSLFIYQAKASRAERNRGCEGLPEGTSTKQFNEGMEGKIRSDGTVIKESIRQSNIHPTVKPIQLMRYLVRMITPPGGIVLDCFAGSGSTLVAAIHEGMHFIGIEQLNTPEEPYITIARARIEQAYRDAGKPDVLVPPAEEWECAEDCPIRLLDEQSGVSKSTSNTRYNKAHKPNAYGNFNNPRITGGHDDQGGASRFFTNLVQDGMFDEVPHE